MHEHHTLPPPLLRGWTHMVSFPLMLVCGIALVVYPHASLTDRMLLAIYVGGTATMFGVSALYHRGRWQPPAKALMQKLDRSAIFLAIGGGFTPIAAVCLDGVQRSAVLIAAWVGSAIGITLQWLPVHRAWKGASYIIVSWTALFVFPELADGLGAVGFSLMLAGGVCYTLGALALAVRWPNPWPRVFGFHEVFHAFTVVASALQFAAISYAVVPLM
ncbi:MAG: hemolysin III family protein [Actinomycetia bacterium]|nr:hemolysin III family protein [Actinomycetes bacterium]